MTDLRPPTPQAPKPLPATEVERLIKTIDQRRFAEGKFQGKDISVELREDKFAMIFKWRVLLWVHSYIDSHFDSEHTSRNFRKRESAERYFDELVKRYDLKELGREKQ